MKHESGSAVTRAHPAAESSQCGFQVHGGATAFRHVQSKVSLGAGQEDMEREVDSYLRRKHPTAISAIEAVSKEDLDLKNHLSGLQQRLLKARSVSAG